MQRERHSTMASVDLVRPRVHSPLSPARPAQRVSARPLLRLARSRRQNPLANHPRPPGFYPAAARSRAPTRTALPALRQKTLLDRHARTGAAAQTHFMNSILIALGCARKRKQLRVAARCCRRSKNGALFTLSPLDPGLQFPRNGSRKRAATIFGNLSKYFGQKRRKSKTQSDRR